MRLKAYLLTRDIRLTDFAAGMGVKITTAHGWVSGRRTPSAKQAVRIEDATNGEVTVRDLLPAEVADNE
jgi:DNA-binding transcriptional regulator YdaS (Cro superfamily)